MPECIEPFVVPLTEVVDIFGQFSPRKVYVLIDTEGLGQNEWKTFMRKTMPIRESSALISE